MNIFVFNLSNQRLRRFTSGVIYANSYGKTIFKFNFNTPDWNYVTKTAVFSYRGTNYSELIDENNMCKVPKEVLHEGYFLVSVYGNGITNNIRIPVEKAPDDLLPDSNVGTTPLVYVPEVTQNNMLVFTLQDNVTDERLEFDIDKSNDWNETDYTTGSSYVWESMQ